MATVFDMVSIKGMRATHFEQIRSYLMHWEEEGIYYGNKDQFIKRHEDIKEWIDAIIDMARDPDNIIPKK